MHYDIWHRGTPNTTDEPRYIDYEHGAKVGRFVADIMRAVADRDSRVAVLPLEERDMSVQC